jgi:hypothetical protein
VSRSSVFVAIMVAALIGLGASPGPAFAAPASGIAFSLPVQVDPQRFVTEPSLTVDPQGHVFTSGPWGFSTGQSFLWRSLDRGDSYDLEKLEVSPVGLRPCSTPLGPGGGDTDQIAFDSVTGQHVVVFVDLEALAGVLTCTSFDGGNTWFTENPLTTTQQAEGGADRMWLGHDVIAGRDVLYLVNDDLVSGGDAAYRSLDYGANWEVVAQPAFVNAAAIGNPGGIAVDQATHTAYFANTDGDNVVVGIAASAATGPLTFTTHVVATMQVSPYPADLVRIALDTSGNAYLTWAEPADDSVKLSVSQDHGATWSTPVSVSAAGTKNFFSAVTAGSSGRAALAWYTTTNQAPLAENSGPWFIAFAQSINALKAAPTFTLARATPHAIHINPVCLQGLNCTAVQPADRNLGDFMSISIDGRGAAFIAYDDTANNLFDPAQTSTAGAPNTHIVRQIGGTSLLASVGQLGKSGAYPTAVTDAAGDAYLPKQGTIGPNIPRLDLRGATLTSDAGGLHARISLADTTGLGITASGGESWMLQWWFNNALYYAKADATPDGLACSAGTPSAIFSTSGNGKAAIYFGAPSAPCHIEAATNTIVIDVSRASVGSPATGSVLYEVSAYSFVWDLPGTLMNQVDATSPFIHTVQ